LTPPTTVFRYANTHSQIGHNSCGAGISGVDVTRADCFVRGPAIDFVSGISALSEVNTVDQTNH
jgi:hypothetical protein